MNVLCLHLCDPASRWAPPAECTQELHWIAVGTVPEALLMVRSVSVDALVIDAPLTSGRTDDILLEVRRASPVLPVIVASAEAGPDDIIRLIRLGAWHVWNAASDRTRMLATLKTAGASHQNSLQHRQQISAVEPWRAALVGGSESMLRMLDVIRLVAARRSSVLITGETGTGKEVVARAIHQAGGRGHLPFVAVNCGAIPANLIESELFGYARGAFTGANTSHAGRFEQANGGTIFLDEIGDLPMELQGKLLRVLQEREIQRLGSSETIRLNVRVLAATNVDLEKAVERKTFREDLYYRLNVVPVRIPALRDRAADIPALVDHFMKKICDAEGLPLKRIDKIVLDRLRSCAWPGNVRQLEHAVETAIILSGEREVLEIADFAVLQPASGEKHSERPAELLVSGGLLMSEDGLDFEETISRLEYSLIQQALARSKGNKARAAELLRMKRTTLLARVRSLESRRDCGDFAVCA